MHLIEDMFHVAPDAGNGTLELAIMLAFLMLLLAVVALRIKRGRPADRGCIPSTASASCTTAAHRTPAHHHLDLVHPDGSKLA
jgi:hypothetical protein